MGERLCQVPVNNMPPKTEKYIVVRLSPETGKLWYWGSWEDEEEAERVSKEINGLVVRRIDRERF